jgi:CO/xanthine dehydrogenase Mo-binding subunit
MGTFGSLTTRMFGPALRAAAAQARQVLLQLASEHLGAPKDRLVVETGVVSVKGEPARKVSKTLDMHMSWLRRKLGEDGIRSTEQRIATVRGVGFRFNVD